MKLIVGIDFGTSTTVVRYRVDGSDVIYPIKDGERNIIPSVIFKQIDGLCFFGGEAMNRWLSGLEGDLISNFKMGLIDKDEEVRREKAGYIREFLKYVHGLFEQQTQHLNATEWDVYISYPAKWDFASVNFMKESIKYAGFSGNIYGVQEINAIARYYIRCHLNEFIEKGLEPHQSMNVFILNMGTETTDIAIMNMEFNEQGRTLIKPELFYPCVDNPNSCGSSEIDRLLSEYVTYYIKKITGRDIEDVFTIHDAKIWKEQYLLHNLQVNRVAPLPQILSHIMRFIGKGDIAKKEFSMNREDFEMITMDYWKHLYNIVSLAINEYRMRFHKGAEDIDLLFLCGDGIPWYAVKNLFNGVGVAGFIGKDNKFQKLKNDSWRICSDRGLSYELVAKSLCMELTYSIEP